MPEASALERRKPVAAFWPCEPTWSDETVGRALLAFLRAEQALDSQLGTQNVDFYWRWRGHRIGDRIAFLVAVLRGRVPRGS